ncbi:MAG: signal peptide peptidase SppA [Candidatus Latescibacteria bacterium]|nr:signal peptide peptidase SppA [Candidatus Latescibacterota bacterium]
MNRRGRWVVGGVIAVGVLLILFVWVAGQSGGGGGFSSLGAFRKVGLVEIEGPIRSSASVIRQLKHYGRDRSIPALVIRVNSPGGEVGATQEIYEEILKLRKEGKRVVASLGGVAASGGYYVAVAADTIVSNPGTLTGSIGVVLELYNFEGLLQKLGLNLYVVKSGKYKDIGSPLRPMLPEEREMLQGVTDDTFDQFVGAVVSGRRLSREAVLKVADGRIFTGRQAQGFGLVDLLGNYEDAVAVAGEMSGLGRRPDTVKEGGPGRWEALLKRLDSELSSLFLQRISARYSIQ